MAHVYAARALVPQMLKRGRGLSAEHRERRRPAGLDGLGALRRHQARARVALAEHLSIQYGDRGIRVSVLCPQAVDTNMLRMAGATAASVDGVINTDAVAQTVIEAMDEERFLILPHPEVKEYMARKLDRDRWLRGMRRLRDKTGEGQGKRCERTSPPHSNGEVENNESVDASRDRRRFPPHETTGDASTCRLTRRSRR